MKIKILKTIGLLGVIFGIGYWAYEISDIARFFITEYVPVVIFACIITAIIMLIIYVWD